MKWAFLEVYELKGDKRAIAAIHYMPQHTHKQQRVMFTLLLEGNKDRWTTGTIDRIFEDVENRIKDVQLLNIASLIRWNIWTPKFPLKKILMTLST